MNEEGPESEQKQGQNALQNAGETIKDAKQIATEGADLAKNVSTGNVLGIAKNAFNLLKNKTFRRMLLIKILLPIIVLILIAAAIYSIFNTVADTIQKVTDSITDFFTQDFEGDGAIVIDNDQIDSIINKITELGIDLEDLYLLGDVDYTNPDTEQANKEAARWYIKQFYQAQAMTQTLNTKPNWLETFVAGSNPYGTVYVYRTNGIKSTEENSEKNQLEYIKYEQLTGKQSDLTQSLGSLKNDADVVSFNNFLFIGDSRTAGAATQLLALGDNINVCGVIGSSPSDWTNVIKNGSGTVENVNVTLPGKDKVSGISVALGVNNPYEIDTMKTVLNNLLSRYPDVPIFVNSVFHVGSAYSGSITAKEMNNQINKFNSQIQSFCSEKDGLYYITVDSGLDSGTYLDSSYCTRDGLHLNTNGNNQLVSNIKNQILGTAEVQYFNPITEEVKDISSEDIVKYFSINPDTGKLVVPAWTTTVKKQNGVIIGNETTVELREIDYKNLVSQYTTTMNFFLYLAMISQNPNFVSAVTDLVKQGRIEITVMDSKSENYTKETHSYIKHTKSVSVLTDSGMEEDVLVPGIEETKKDSYTIETTVTTVEPVVKITYAKTWFSEQTITYNKKEDDTGLIEGKEISDGKNDAEPSTPTSVGSVSWITDRKVKIDTQYKTEIYEESVRGDVIDKTGEKGDGPISFIGLMDEQFQIPNSSRTDSAAGNIISGAEMLFELLQKDSASQNLEQVMRYILYKYTGRDYGVTEFDFNIFDATDFTSISGIYGNTIEEKVWYTLREAGFSEYAVAGVMGNIYAESGFNASVIESSNGVGFGLCQWSYGRRTQLEKYAASKGIDPSDVDTQIEFLLTEITPGANGPAKGYANYQLISYNGYNGNSWQNADSPSNAAIAFCWSFERPGTPRMSVRTEAAERYYVQFHGKTRPSGGTILQVADSLHRAQTSWSYSVGTGLTSGNIEKAINNPSKVTCCATYVSSVIYEAGLVTESEINAINYNYCPTLYNFLVSKGWQKITSYSSIQPGDIVFLDLGGGYNSHVQIYAGSNMWYSDGSEEAIKKAQPYNQGNWASSNFGRALRPPVTTTIKATDANVQTFIASLQKISNKIVSDRKNGINWYYSNSKVKSTFDLAVSTGIRKTNCADYVCWALKDIGVLQPNEAFYGYTQSVPIKYKGGYSASKIKQWATMTCYNGQGKTIHNLINAGKVKAGDIILYSHQHTNVYAGGGKFYDAGRMNALANYNQGYFSNGTYYFKTLGPVVENISSMYVSYVIRFK